MVWSSVAAEVHARLVDCLERYDAPPHYWPPECPGAPPRAPHVSLAYIRAASTGEWGDWDEAWAGPYPVTDQEYSDLIGCVGAYASTPRCRGRRDPQPGRVPNFVSGAQPPVATVPRPGLQPGFSENVVPWLVVGAAALAALYLARE